MVKPGFHINASDGEVSQYRIGDAAGALTMIRKRLLSISSLASETCPSHIGDASAISLITISWFPVKSSSRIDEDPKTMQRKQFQELNTFQLFSSRGGSREHYRDSGDFSITLVSTSW